ncbi:MAG: tetratricopeptide repeat protein [Thermodesulfobacteriota bacterium]|nr:tetratricopeptide repeat protein [Thermodesulfobacteriota bacterium]
MQNRYIIPFIGSIVLINLIIFGGSIGFDFVNWDDYEYICDNRLIKNLSLHNIKEIFTSFYAGTYVPFVFLSFSFEYLLYGLAPFVYHTTNITFHIFNNILVFFLIFRLSNSFLVSAICALLFGVHPIHVESVVWVTARKDVLSAFFFLLSIIYYLFYNSKYCLSLLFFICALLSKPMVITLPFILILCDYYLYGSFYNKKYLLKKIPFFIISFIFAIITVISQHRGDAISHSQLISIFDNILIALKGVVFYLEKTILPINLSAFYPYPKVVSIVYPSFFLPLIILGGIIFFAYFSRKFTKKILFCSLFFIITLLPVLKLVPFGDVPVADRFMYIPSIGLFFMAGIAFNWIYHKQMRWNKPKKISIMLILFIVVASYSTLTIRRTAVWKDGESLWLDVIKQYPEVPQAHNNLGIIYKKKGMIEEAFAEFNKALSLSSKYIDVHNNIGLIYEEKLMLNEAINEYRKALGIDPDNIVSLNNLGNIYYKKGLLNKALFYNRKAMGIEPNCAETHNNLGNIYRKKGMFQKALDEYNRALKINPDFEKVYFNLGLMYEGKGLVEKAIAAYEKALKIDPDYTDALNNLGNIYNKKGGLDKAISVYKNLLKVNSKNAIAHYNLANIYQKKNSLNEAIIHYKRAIEINPDYAEAFNNLGNVYNKKGMLNKAIAKYKRAIEINRKYAEAYNNLGIIYHKKGMLKEALGAYKNALEIKQDLPHAHYNSSLIYYYIKDFKNASYHYKNAKKYGYGKNKKLEEILNSLTKKNK